ncbi:zinc-dependent alcohol dehydrogenase family protein [Tessaracoccus antarcticus]|uniref:Alcohol dehydrogenase n=1 Tax=Tessaracoccus antarcticus TaxID=2479848 RepID=A0A3M0FXS0_9ACTN|nr:zinc-binding dehydrogenase [Tessaracoccus antarcticus]RMB57474.1 alcohol dehydrogenase [Tessaracoccus antarcticus]
MFAAYLPGGSRVELKEVPDPEPGYGQVRIAMRASTICGSDLRAIYREHLGSGPEAYQGVVGGHEPAGRVESIGGGVGRIKAGDRVVVYHISGCGQCDECRKGYQISCLSPQRAAYGWQRDGGHATYMIADERDCLVLPDSLTFVDGACVACGFGTAYEALRRIDVSGHDSLLITGLGPVGLAAGLMGRKLGSPLVVGVDPSAARRELALKLGAVDAATVPGSGELSTLMPGGADTAIDCSGSGQGQLATIDGTRPWGRVALVGEGGVIDGLDVSHAIIHKQLTIHGSWVTSTGHMAELLRQLDRWDLHPEQVVTETFPLEQVAEAYAAADAAQTGKVSIVWKD